MTHHRLAQPSTYLDEAIQRKRCVEILMQGLDRIFQLIQLPTYATLLLSITAVRRMVHLHRGGIRNALIEVC